MSLSNLTVAITSSRRGVELSHIVKSFGGIPYLTPTVGIMDAGISLNQIEIFINSVRSQPMEYFIFMTGLSVQYLFRAASVLKLKDELMETVLKSRVISRGNKPSLILRKLGVLKNIELGPNTAFGILDTLKYRDVRGKRIAVVSNGNGNEAFKEQLELQGSKIYDLQLYSYSSFLDKTADSVLEELGYRQHATPRVQATSKLIRDIINGAVHAITFTSPPSVYGLFKVSDADNNISGLTTALNERIIVASVGPSTSEALRKFGVDVDVMPKINKMGPMIKALSDYISSSMNNIEVDSKTGKILKNLNMKERQCK
ncbi:MAG TPA: uroporphyrinogen-III synthase [Nitrososphaeraceae archaeon]|jgi:uroporphyrinogen-III synthase